MLFIEVPVSSKESELSDMCYEYNICLRFSDFPNIFLLLPHTNRSIQVEDNVEIWELF